MTDEKTEFVVGEIKGELPHKCVVGMRDGKLTYVAGSEYDRLGRGERLHSDIAKQFGVDAYGGSHVCFHEGNLRIIGMSGTYGGVPEDVLEKFDLLPRYQAIYPELKDAKLEIFESCISDYKWKNFR